MESPQSPSSSVLDSTWVYHHGHALRSQRPLQQLLSSDAPVPAVPSLPSLQPEPLAPLPVRRLGAAAHRQYGSFSPRKQLPAEVHAEEKTSDATSAGASPSAPKRALVLHPRPPPAVAATAAAPVPPISLPESLSAAAIDSSVTPVSSSTLSPYHSVFHSQRAPIKPLDAEQIMRMKNRLDLLPPAVQPHPLSAQAAKRRSMHNQRTVQAGDMSPVASDFAADSADGAPSDYLRKRAPDAGQQLQTELRSLLRPLPEQLASSSSRSSDSLAHMKRLARELRVAHSNRVLDLSLDARLAAEEAAYPSSLRELAMQTTQTFESTTAPLLELLAPHVKSTLTALSLASRKRREQLEAQKPWLHAPAFPKQRPGAAAALAEEAKELTRRRAEEEAAVLATAAAVAAAVHEEKQQAATLSTDSSLSTLSPRNSDAAAAPPAPSTMATYSRWSRKPALISPRGTRRIPYQSSLTSQDRVGHVDRVESRLPPEPPLTQPQLRETTQADSGSNAASLSVVHSQLFVDDVPAPALFRAGLLHLQETLPVELLSGAIVADDDAIEGWSTQGSASHSRVASKASVSQLVSSKPSTAATAGVLPFPTRSGSRSGQRARPVSRSRSRSRGADSGTERDASRLSSPSRQASRPPASPPKAMQFLNRSRPLSREVSPVRGPGSVVGMIDHFPAGPNGAVSPSPPSTAAGTPLVGPLGSGAARAVTQSDGFLSSLLEEIMPTPEVVQRHAQARKEEAQRVRKELREQVRQKDMLEAEPDTAGELDDEAFSATTAERAVALVEPADPPALSSAAPTTDPAVQADVMPVGQSSAISVAHSDEAGDATKTVTAAHDENCAVPPEATNPFDVAPEPASTAAANHTLQTIEPSVASLTPARTDSPGGSHSYAGPARITFAAADTSLQQAPSAQQQLAKVVSLSLLPPGAAAPSVERSSNAGRPPRSNRRQRSAMGSVDFTQTTAESSSGRSGSGDITRRRTATTEFMKLALAIDFASVAAAAAEAASEKSAAPAAERAPLVVDLHQEAAKFSFREELRAGQLERERRRSFVSDAMNALVQADGGKLQLSDVQPLAGARSPRDASSSTRMSTSASQSVLPVRTKPQRSHAQLLVTPHTQSKLVAILQGASQRQAADGSQSARSHNDRTRPFTRVHVQITAGDELMRQRRLEVVDKPHLSQQSEPEMLSPISVARSHGHYLLASSVPVDAADAALHASILSQLASRPRALLQLRRLVSEVRDLRAIPLECAPHQLKRRLLPRVEARLCEQLRTLLQQTMTLLALLQQWASAHPAQPTFMHQRVDVQARVLCELHDLEQVERDHMEIMRT